MDKPIQLVPLVCLHCSTPIPAEVDEVAWVCAQCEQGQFLNKQVGLEPLEVNFSAAISQNTAGKPHWVAEGRVTLSRETYGSGGKQTREAEQFWSKPHRFFVPAFTAPLEALLSQATSLLLQPPDMQPGPAVRFEPVTLSAEDILPAAEFIVVAIEASRKDMLKQIDFNLELSPPALWILP